MTELTPIVRTIADLRAQITEWRKEGLSVGLVPTMGALHSGHLSLVNTISKHADKVVVSIFINAKQFGADDDLEKYPKQEEADRLKLSSTPADLVYAPSTDEMYPDGHVTSVSLTGISEILEGARRPGHFEGVATVVTKLLLQCAPDTAIFGEKDYQQLTIIRQFVKDLDIPVKIIGGRLIREADGLAASSRNAYLSDDDRQTASMLNRTLYRLVKDAQAGENLRQAEKKAIETLLASGFTYVDYVSIADGETLEPLDEIVNGARVLAVARIGSIRLLDNMAIETP